MLAVLRFRNWRYAAVWSRPPLAQGVRRQPLRRRMGGLGRLVSIISRFRFTPETVASPEPLGKGSLWWALGAPGQVGAVLRFGKPRPPHLH